MAKVVIGLTGLFAGGCGTAAECLKNKGFKIYSLTSIIKKECEKRKIRHPQRHDLQNIGDELRKSNNPDFLAKEIKIKIDNNEDKILIKSIRNNYEALYLKDVYNDLYLININSDIETRFKRTKEYTSYDDFKRDDERDAGIGQPEYGQKVNKCAELADIIIDNSGSKKDFCAKLNKYLDLIEKPGSQPPIDIEINMAQAYFWSLRSQCLQRKVGAIIVKNGHIIASGYNDVPKKVIIKNNEQIEITSGSCLSLFGMCYRNNFTRCLSCKAIITTTSSKCEVCQTEVGKEQLDALNKHLDLCRALHAEERAILQVAKLGGQSLEKATLYTTTFPCQLCAKKIFEVGIAEVVYISPYPYPEAKRLLKDAKVNLRPFEGVKSKAFDKLYAI